MKYITTIDEKEFVVDIVDDHHVVVNDKVFEVDFEIGKRTTVIFSSDKRAIP